MIPFIAIVLLVIAAVGMLAWRLRPASQAEAEVGPLAQRLRDASRGAAPMTTKDLS